MAYANPFFTDQFWFGYKDQTDLVTPAVTGATNTWERPKLTDFPEYANPDGAIQVPGSSGQVAVDNGTIPGSQHGGSLKLKAFLRSQASGYTGATVPVGSPMMQLIADLLGGESIGDATAAVVGAVGNTANHIDLSGGVFGDGDPIAWGNSVSAVAGIGFLTEASAGDLLEDAASIPVAAEPVFPFYTAYAATGQPVPKTGRVVGPHADHDFRLIGMVGSKLVVNAQARQPVQIEYEARYTDFFRDTSGGLEAVPSLQYLPALIGVNGARLQINGVADADGTVDATDVYCVNAFKLEIERSLTDLECPNARQGVIKQHADDPEIRITFDVELDEAEITANLSIWESRYFNQTPFSVGYYHGNKAGQLMAMTMKNSVVMARPQETVINGKVVGLSIMVKPALYSGDASSTGPGNSVFAMGIG